MSTPDPVRLLAALEQMAANPKARPSARAASQRTLDHLREEFAKRDAARAARAKPPQGRNRLGQFIAKARG